MENKKAGGGMPPKMFVTKWSVVVVPVNHRAQGAELGYSGARVARALMN